MGKGSMGAEVPRSSTLRVIGPAVVLVNTIRKTGCRQRIGDEDQRLGRKELRRPLEQIWMDVNAICDDLRGHGMIHEDRTKGTRLTVMESAHRIVQVRHVSDSLLESCPRFLKGRLGMTE